MTLLGVGGVGVLRWPGLACGMPEVEVVHEIGFWCEVGVAAKGRANYCEMEWRTLVAALQCASFLTYELATM